MEKVVVSSDKAPKATGPFSQAIIHSPGHTMELSGQIGLNPDTGKLVEGGIREETEQTLRNIENVLSEAGMDFNNLIKVRIFLTSMSDYGTVNEIYAKWFDDKPPARVALGVKELPLGASIEIECTAAGEPKKI